MEDKYYIAPNKYRELKYFCLQYKEKKDKLKSICCISAVEYKGQPHGTSVSNPTAEFGEKIAQLRKDIELIEQTAIEANSDFFEQLLENVTKGVPWEYLDIPMSRRNFYYLRRKYFYFLSEKRL
ncbi:MAG: hypothetical protein AB7E42_10240 [Anaerotignaceae bacterium]